jgi:hypothetical protein
MTTEVLTRIGTWFAETFRMDDADQAQATVADAVRWGWLPALSGLSIAGEPAGAEGLDTGQALGL